LHTVSVVPAADRGLSEGGHGQLSSTPSWPTSEICCTFSSFLCFSFGGGLQIEACQKVAMASSAAPPAGPPCRVWLSLRSSSQATAAPSQGRLPRTSSRVQSPAAARTQKSSCRTDPQQGRRGHSRAAAVGGRGTLQGLLWLCLGCGRCSRGLDVRPAAVGAVRRTSMP
jgi:hypothetical protein